jgi:hypothetical protein
MVRLWVSEEEEGNGVLYHNRKECAHVISSPPLRNPGIIIRTDEQPVTRMNTLIICTLRRSPPLGISSSPKITLPKTIARFLASILFLSLLATTRERCSRMAFKVAWCTGGSRRILERKSKKLFDRCSSTV